MGSQTLVGGEAEDITFSKIQKVLETFDDQVTFLKKQYVKTIEKRDDSSTSGSSSRTTPPTSTTASRSRSASTSRRATRRATA